MRRILLATPLFLGLLFLSYTANSNETGAPVGRTGAPSENTCNASGCHNSFTLNEGPGSVAITVGNGVMEYVPDSTYEVFVRVAYPDRVRYGFEITAYAGNLQAGTFALLETDSTQIRTNLLGQQYVTHLFAGTIDGTPGDNVYNLSWTAPSAGTGRAILYAAGNATNNNGTNQGDFIYTTQLVLEEEGNPTAEEQPVTDALKLYPNPAQAGVTLKAPSFLHGAATVRYLDLQGRSQHSQPTLLAQGHAYLQRPAGLAPGTYLLRLEQDGRHWQQKLVLH